MLWSHSARIKSNTSLSQIYLPKSGPFMIHNSNEREKNSFWWKNFWFRNRKRFLFVFFSMLDLKQTPIHGPNYLFCEMNSEREESPNGFFLSIFASNVELETPNSKKNIALHVFCTDICLSTLKTTRKQIILKPEIFNGRLIELDKCFVICNWKFRERKWFYDYNNCLKWKRVFSFVFSPAIQFKPNWKINGFRFRLVAPFFCFKSVVTADFKLNTEIACLLIIIKRARTEKMP